MKVLHHIVLIWNPVSGHTPAFSGLMAEVLHNVTLDR
jgi:hypothetical protein